MKKSKIRILCILVGLLLILGMVVPAFAASYGIDIGAIQDSVGRAVEQEARYNPDWFTDWLESLYARYR